MKPIPTPNETVLKPEEPAPGLGRVQPKMLSTVDRVSSGFAGTLWRRLNAVHFRNSAFNFAALAVVASYSSWWSQWR
jgi:hypothetical protein